MRNYNDNNRSGRSRGGRRFDDRGSNRSHSGSRGSGRSQMHDAVCDDCSNNCQVPFMPTSGKPIYCSDCFEKRGNGNSRRPSSSNRGDFSSSRNNSQENSKQFKIINEKLDKILEALSPKEEKAKVKKTKKKKPKKVTEEKIVEPKVTPEIESVPEVEVAPEIEVVPEVEIVTQPEVAPETEIVPEVEVVEQTEVAPEVEVVAEEKPV